MSNMNSYSMFVWIVWEKGFQELKVTKLMLDLCTYDLWKLCNIRENLYVSMRLINS